MATRHDCSTDSTSEHSNNTSSSDNDVEMLLLTYSSSSFEEYTDDNLISPYKFEPSDSAENSRSDDPESEGSDHDDPEIRLKSLAWCTCGKCKMMPTSTECVCCQEIPQITNKLLFDKIQEPCITLHPGFPHVCLNVWVLQTAYYNHQRKYGNVTLPAMINECYRHTSYRQLTHWCWGWLGKKYRVVLPACAVTKIRETFPSNYYTGFNL